MKKHETCKKQGNMVFSKMTTFSLMDATESKLHEVANIQENNENIQRNKW